ncbi:MAG: hypothetical protein OXC14_17310 [Rhodospirillaceae bacterium]|nr:hypothetical protein [Rhodospirillaceae bacterium]
MSRYVTELTDEEKTLVEAIDLRMWPPMDEHSDVCRANKRPILALLTALTQRRGIPEQRWKYWSNPTYRIGGTGKSTSRDVFEKNGNVGDEAYVHPHFIPYLRYFLFGPYLPSEVIAKFEEKVGNPGWVTSGDIMPLGKLARDLTRQHPLPRDGAALEFFKLCLDIGLDPNVARSVRDSVMKIRPGLSYRW